MDLIVEKCCAVSFEEDRPIVESSTEGQPIVRVTKLCKYL